MGAALSLAIAVPLLTPGPATVAVVAVAVLYAALLAGTRRAERRMRRQAAQTEHGALHDPVTGLPNRVLFHDRAQHAIAHAGRLGTSVAVVVLDLDRFKEVNDTLGHHNGDLLLRVVGERLSAAVRAGDSVARLGGDEFAVL